MNLITCLHTNSGCYNAAQPAEQKGILIHSTGINQTKLSRYVQPSKTDPSYNELIKVIGLNKNNNSWNKSGSKKAVHYMIGKLADGSIATCYTIPEEMCCWGCGRGSKGSYNYNPTAHIQFEVLEDALTDESYFNKVYKEAVELCAYICKAHGWEANVIVSHKEAYKEGYASNHGDIDHWLKKFGCTMDSFREDVSEMLHPTPKPETVKYQIGDVCVSAATKQYTNANASENKAKKAKGGRVKVIDTYYSGKHPYCVRTINEKGKYINGTYGWVDTEFLSPEPIVEVEPELKVGDRVKIASGATVYGSTKKFSSWVYKSKMYVRDIQKDGDKIVFSILKKGAVTGSTHKDNIIKL